MGERQAARKVLVWVTRDTPEGPRVLLLQRAAPHAAGEWHPVTGHVDAGEDVADAARREVHEETGFTDGTLVDLDYRHSFPGAFRGVDYLYEEHAFAYRVPADAAECLISHEHQAFEWVAPDAARARLRFPEHAEALARLAARTR